ncbi:hypothetical protein BDZ97DRAFT_1753698 [Flammula alnicola]|nr:hypothetical protein BDZ97DRAFT_1753698 [Flammula alnicola]
MELKSAKPDKSPPAALTKPPKPDKILAVVGSNPPNPDNKLRELPGAGAVGLRGVASSSRLIIAILQQRGWPPIERSSTNIKVWFCARNDSSVPAKVQNPCQQTNPNKS